MPAQTDASTPAGALGAPAELRSQLGAFYTPTHAVQHMVRKLRHLNADSRILEPSGGDGAFVAGLLEYTDVLPEQVQVWDIDPAVGATFAKFNVPFTSVDSLLDAPVGEHFSHIVGNPPYLNKQSEYVKANRARLRSTYKDIGANDTYAMFMRMGLDRLRPGGQLVFLVSDTFLTLGIYRRLREHLLNNARIDAITLLPADTFPDAAVRTAVIDLTRGPAPPGHLVEFTDLRRQEPGDYTPKNRHAVPQQELGANPQAVFAFEPSQREVLSVMAACPPLFDLLDGGLGMFTRDNGAYLGVVSRDGSVQVSPRPGMPVVPEADVDGVVWRFYHKRGGASRWWRPAEHCVRWDDEAQAAYGIPATAKVDTAADGSRRRGLVVSGVATSLTARTLTPGAAWESNKAFGLFPKDPDRWPVEFFLALFNSAWYDTAANALNHTVSLQIRDVQALPLLPFTRQEVDNLASLGDAAVAHVRAGCPGQPPQTATIEQVIVTAAARVTR